MPRYGNVNVVVNQGAESKRWSPFIALCLSIVPGLGQLYKGRPLRGLLWFLATAIGYSLVVPGLILHAICAFYAATGEP